MPLTPLPDFPETRKDLAAALQELEQQLTLSDAKLQDISHRFLFEYNKGLNHVSTASDTESFLPQIPTFVHEVPNGTETGEFLALDLGGTNLRVCLCQLSDQQGKFQLKQTKYKVSEELKTGEADVLFDFIADCVQKFLQTERPELLSAPPHNKVFLGFTFSFPVRQSALAAGTLIHWTKGFDAKHSIGTDVVQMLQLALNRRQLPVACEALVNDTVGTMLSLGYQSGTAHMGAIFGTGTNAAYLESLDKVQTLDNRNALGFKTMVVNTEWGSFDNDRAVLPFTPYDNKVDRESINPRKQAFEKFISGMYLGEVTRNVILGFIDRNLLFNGYSSPLLNAHYGFDSALMSNIEQRHDSFPSEGASPKPLHSDDYERVRRVLHDTLKLPLDKLTDVDCAAVFRISELVGLRAAHLSGTAIAATCQQTNNVGKDFHVGVDGSLVEFYPHFIAKCREAIIRLLGKDANDKIVVGLAKDGSGLGAALCALQAKKQVQASQ